RPLGCRSANGRLVRSGGTRHWPRRERSFDATQHANCQSKPDQDQPTYDRNRTGCDDRRIECAPLDRHTRSHKKNSSRSYYGTQNQQKRIHTPVPPDSDARRPQQATIVTALSKRRKDNIPTDVRDPRERLTGVLTGTSCPQTL